jgi:hypothetical protein
MSVLTRVTLRKKERTRRDDERELAALATAGDPVAFGSLIDLHHASLLRLARAFAQDEAEAQRVVAAAWLAMLEMLPACELDRPFKAWMMKIVVAMRAGTSDESASIMGVELEGSGPADEGPDVPGRPRAGCDLGSSGCRTRRSHAARRGRARGRRYLCRARHHHP